MDPKTNTHQYLCLFMLFMGLSFLNDEGWSQIIQASGSC